MKRLIPKYEQGSTITSMLLPMQTQLDFSNKLLSSAPTPLATYTNTAQSQIDYTTVFSNDLKGTPISTVILKPQLVLILSTNILKQTPRFQQSLQQIQDLKKISSNINTPDLVLSTALLGEPKDLNKINLKLVRTKRTDQGTWGTMYMYNTKNKTWDSLSEIIEPVDRGLTSTMNKTQVARIKKKGRGANGTAIGIGSNYIIGLRNSGKFGPNTLTVETEEYRGLSRTNSHAGIRCHGGSSPNDSEGCLVWPGQKGKNARNFLKNELAQSSSKEATLEIVTNYG